MPFVPDSMVRMVTLLEVDELGVDGGLKRLNLVFVSMIFRSESSDGSGWYLDFFLKDKDET